MNLVVARNVVQPEKHRTEAAAAVASDANSAKCSLQFVQLAVNKQLFLSNQVVKSRFTAVTVTNLAQETTGNLVI